MNDDLAKLKQHFPHCFDKDGNFQLEKFKNNLTKKEINFSTESYGLDWLGKSYARLLASDPATTLLKADESHNAKPENINSENLLIKGDNLEVLKHLVNAYHEQVKMIYIDPPYNTGSDGFVYNDDRKFTVAQLQELTGVDTDKAKRILDFTKQKSNSHSAWLTFMYPRLYIAKQLLRDDGVIFVSIDDNEVAQLRLLMDEVFGEENFVSEIIWNSKYTTSNDAKYVSNQHEPILFYAKNKNNFNIGLLPRTDKQDKDYKNKDNDPKGPWKATPLHAKSGTESNNYKITFLNGKIWSPPNGRYPIYSKDKIQKLYHDGELYFNSNGGVDKKTYLSEVKEGLTVGSLWKYDEVGHTHSNNEELAELVGKGVFDNPKGSKLIKRILLVANTHSELILDFFAGSGTTGDAVMQLNAEDGGNRKYILVQLPEQIDEKKNKTAYDFVKNELKAEPTIFEITKERLLRAAKKLNTNLDEQILKLKQELDTQENQTEIDRLERCKTQNTFKTFETTPIWEDYNFEAEKFDNTQTLFDAGKLSKDDIKSLLITWKTYDGIALTHDLESIDLEGYTAYYGGGTLYLMDKDFSSTNLKALLTMIDTEHSFSPSSIICFGYHFESARIRELAENIKSYSNKKNIDIDFVTRY
ncbi:MAG: site-specific DNA-methyltransferase [Sphingobacteriaceae bacterium]|nr:site-specific DNA-methyltransferase [Sphingobacteriaceae bacterium]